MNNTGNTTIGLPPSQPVDPVLGFGVLGGFLLFCAVLFIYFYFFRVRRWSAKLNSRFDEYLELRQERRIRKSIKKASEQPEIIHLPDINRQINRPVNDTRLTMSLPNLSSLDYQESEIDFSNRNRSMREVDLPPYTPTQNNDL